MIPLSSRVEKYKRIVEKKERSGKSCDILHIVKLDDSRESVFLNTRYVPNYRGIYRIRIKEKYKSERKKGAIMKKWIAPF